MESAASDIMRTFICSPPSSAGPARGDCSPLEPIDSPWQQSATTERSNSPDEVNGMSGAIEQ